MRYLFPALGAALSLGSAAVSFCEGDWRRGGYWLACVAIAFFVTV